MKKEYKNDEITVTWQPDVCIHSEKCFHGLPKVFNPKNRPWVNLDDAENKVIIDQVNTCPSGALSGRYNHEEQQNDSSNEVPSVEIMPNGPILMKGNLQLKYNGKDELKEAKVTAFCRCGASGNKPFCDGSHSKVGFED
jgi:uncharacterized Fe-S cluster protein YjdI